jgi:hypothetical protein
LCRVSCKIANSNTGTALAKLAGCKAYCYRTRALGRIACGRTYGHGSVRLSKKTCGISNRNSKKGLIKPTRCIAYGHRLLSLSAFST